MVALTDTIKDITGEAVSGDDIHTAFVRSPTQRPSYTGQGLVSTRPVKISDGGELSLDLEPGPAVLVVLGPAFHDTWELYVEEGQSTIRDAAAAVPGVLTQHEVSVLRTLLDGAERAAGDADDAKGETLQAAGLVSLDRQHVDSIRALLDEAAENNVAPYLTPSALRATYGRVKKVNGAEPNASGEVTVETGVLARQISRRSLTEALLKQAAGGWYLTRRSEDEYRFSRDVGAGLWADFQVHRNDVGTAVQPNPSLSVRDVSLGVPMVAAPETQITFGGTWIRGSLYTTGARPRLGVTLFPPSGSFTVTTTAGSQTIAVTPGYGAGLAGDYTGRAVMIPGAGTGGADYHGVMIDAGSNVVKPAVPTAVSGAPIIFYGRRRFTFTAGATATFTTPAGSTRVGLIHYRAANAGVLTVSINGDLTRATSLPTAQEAVDSGRAAASILTTNGGTVAPTTRVLLAWHEIEQYAAWTALAVDLPPGAHTVVVTVATGATYLVGFGHGSGATKLSDSGTYVFATTQVCKPMPTNDYAIQVRTPTGPTATYLGGVGHGYEVQVDAPTVAVDGIIPALADGERRKVEHAASLVKSSHLFHPSNLSTPVAKVTTTYTLGEAGLTVNNVIDWLATATIDTAYLAMWAPSRMFEYAQLDDSADEIYFPAMADYTFAGNGRATSAAWWQPGGRQTVTAVLVPTAEKITGGWSAGVTIRNVAGEGKFYPRRTGSAVSGDRWGSDATYMVGRLPAGGDYYFPIQ